MILSELAAQRTQIIQRDIGLNLRIIPADTDLEAYWIKGYAEGVMDQSLLSRIAEQEVANRLVPMLQRTIPGAMARRFSQEWVKSCFPRASSSSRCLAIFKSSTRIDSRVRGRPAPWTWRGDGLLLFDQEFTVQKYWPRPAAWMTYGFTANGAGPTPTWLAGQAE